MTTASKFNDLRDDYTATLLLSVWHMHGAVNGEQPHVCSVGARSDDDDEVTDDGCCPWCLGTQRIVYGDGSTRPCECAPTQWDREPESYEK